MSFKQTENVCTSIDVQCLQILYFSHNALCVTTPTSATSSLDQGAVASYVATEFVLLGATGFCRFENFLISTCHSSEKQVLFCKLTLYSPLILNDGNVEPSSLRLLYHPKESFECKLFLKFWTTTFWVSILSDQCRNIFQTLPKTLFVLTLGISEGGVFPWAYGMFSC